MVRAEQRISVRFSDDRLTGLMERVHVYFGNPSGSLAPELLVALRDACLTERARVLAEAMAAFGAPIVLGIGPADERGARS